MINIRKVIAEQCIDGPCWIRSFQDVKAVLDAMVADGELALVAPANGVGRNMVGLTHAGARKYRLRVQDHFLFTTPEKPPRKDGRFLDPVERAKQRDIVAERGEWSHFAIMCRTAWCKPQHGRRDLVRNQSGFRPASSIGVR